MTAPTIASLITPLIGRAVIATDKHGAETMFTIAKLSDKIGTLKDGTKGEYVVLTKDGETGVVLNVHPNTAKKLATKGEGDMLKLVPAAEGNGAEPAASGEGENGDAAPNDAAAAPVDEAPEAKEPKVTKKSQTIAIFTEMTAAGKVRKDIIAKMKTDLGLSDSGANTYYQNCKSGAWTA